MRDMFFHDAENDLHVVETHYVVVQSVVNHYIYPDAIGVMVCALSSLAYSFASCELLTIKTQV